MGTWSRWKQKEIIRCIDMLYPTRLSGRNSPSHTLRFPRSLLPEPDPAPTIGFGFCTKSQYFRNIVVGLDGLLLWKVWKYSSVGRVLKAFFDFVIGCHEMKKSRRKSQGAVGCAVTSSSKTSMEGPYSSSPSSCRVFFGITNSLVASCPF